MDADENYRRQIERRIDNLEVKMDGLMAWRSWILGLVAGMGILVGAFAKQVAYILTHL